MSGHSKSKTKFTKRTKLVKLELSSQTSLAINKVAANLYDIKNPSLNPTIDNETWYTTDALYADAKKAYDGILKTFLEEPIIYKLESTKEKLHAQSFDKNQDIDPNLDRINEFLEKEIPLIDENVLNTYIDPFDLPKPWEKKFEFGQFIYFNPETFERLEIKPQEIWSKKIESLSKLVQRDDLDGYEYKESAAEKRYRTKVQDDFDKKLQAKIKRRQEDPTDLEQVEDTLYLIVDKICKADELTRHKIKKEELRKLREPYHVATKGFRMASLGVTETEDGETNHLITDLDFIDCILTDGNYVLPCAMPYDLLEKHEEERARAREIENQRLLLEENEKNKPLVEKTKELLKELRRDPKPALKKLGNDFKIGMKKLPSLVKTKGTELFIKSNKIVLSSLNSALIAAKTPKSSFLSAVDNFKNVINSMRANQNKNELDIDDILEEMAGDEAKKAEEEEKKRLHEEWLRTRSKAPVPIEHPDVAIVKLTLTIDPPPRWVKKKPKKTLKDHLRDKQEQIQNITGIDIDDYLYESDEEVKEIFDTSEFDDFEKKLLKEIAESVNIPIRALSIEEIRYLPTDDEKVLAFVERNKAIFEQQLLLELEQKKKLEDEFNKKVEKFEEILDIKLPKLNLVNKIISGPVQSNLNSDNKNTPPEPEPDPIKTVDSKNDIRVNISENVWTDPEPFGFVNMNNNNNNNNNLSPDVNVKYRSDEQLTDREIVSDIIELIMRKLISGNNSNEETDLNFHYDPVESNLIDKEDQNKLLALGLTGQHPEDIENDESEDENNLKFPKTKPKFDKYHPKHPEYLKVGIPNIDELKHDPKYWLAKELHQLNEEKLRSIRINKLKKLETLEGLDKFLKEMKEKKQNLIDEVLDYVEPLKDTILPLAVAIGRKTIRNIRKLNPFKKKATIEDSILHNSLPNHPKEILELMDEMCAEVELRYREETEKVILLLNINEIVCSDLQNVEFIGDNDPFVKLTFGSWVFETDFIDGAGNYAAWNDLNVTLKTTESELQSNKLLVQVYDHNELRAHSLIGEFPLDLYSVLNDLNKDSLVKFNILGKSGDIAGQVKIKFGMKTEFTQSMLNVVNLEIKELLNEMCVFVEEEHMIYTANRFEISALFEEMLAEIEYRNLPEVVKSVMKATIVSKLPENKKKMSEINAIQRNLQESIKKSNFPEAEVFLSLMYNSRIKIYPEEVVYLMDKISNVIAFDELYEITSDEDNNDEDEDDDDDDDDDDDEDEDDEDDEEEDGDEDEADEDEADEDEEEAEKEDENKDEDKEQDPEQELEIQEEQNEKDHNIIDNIEGDNIEDKFDSNRDSKDLYNMENTDKSKNDVDNIDDEDDNSNGDDSSVEVSSVHSSDLSEPIDLLNTQHKEYIPPPKKILIGQKSCEISLKIFVPKELKQLEGLHDLKAIDISFYLRDQVFDRKSKLLNGMLSRHIVDIKFFDAYNRRNFEKWEQYWVYMISPIYFGYSTSLIRKKDRNLNQSNTLPDGITFVNPTSLFSQRVKDAYFALTGGKLEKRLGKRALEKTIVNLNVDEFAGEKLLEIYRPNMQELTKRDVDKCRRVWKAFEDLYETEMKTGLVDGKRLKIQQYQAMRSRDDAFRIYRTARQRFSRDDRKIGLSDEPILKVTHVSDELYSGWMKEVREEEEKILKELRTKAELMKVIRIQEAETRMKYNSQKSWMLNKIITLSPDKIIFGKILQEVLEKEESDRMLARSSESTEVHKHQFEEKERHNKELLIHTEKQTRVLFDQYLKNHDLFHKNNSQSFAAQTRKKYLLDYLEEGKAQLFDHRERVKQIKELEIKMEIKREESRRLEKIYESIDLAKGLIKDQLIENTSKEIKELKSSLESLSITDIQNAISKIENNKISTFTFDEMEIFSDSKWIEVIFSSPDFFQCLYDLPCTNEEMITKDELSQFSTIVMQIYPVVMTVKYIIAKNKEQEAQALGLKSQRDKKKLDRKLARKNNEKISEDIDDDLLDDKQLGLKNEARKRAQKQLLAQRRRKFREEEWESAHQHLFVAIPGEAPFCVACKEVAFRLWVRRQNIEEKKWGSESSDFIADKLESLSTALYPYVKSFILKSEATTAAMNKKKESTPVDIYECMDSLIKKIESKNKLIFTSGDSIHPGKWVNGMRFPLSMPIIADNLPVSVIRSGLCLLDCVGINILGKGASDLTPIELPSDRPITPEIFGPPPSVMIRVWNKSENEKKEFLGRIIIPAVQMLNPELGIRAYALEEDPTIFKTQENERRKNEAIEKHKNKGKKDFIPKVEEPIVISGKLFLRISVPRSDKDDIPLIWRIEILKASKIAAVSNAKKSDPYCEIFWRGSAEKEGVTKEYTEWLDIGKTKSKERTVDPQWKKEDDNTYEMPPIWTNYDVQGRAPDWSDLKGGAWVGKNKIPPDDPAAAKNKLSALDRIRKQEKDKKELGEKKVLNAMHNRDEKISDIFEAVNSEEYAENARIELAVKSEINLRLEMYRYLMDSEETERKNMAIEDQIVRRHLIDSELLRTKKYIEEQVDFSRRYSKIIFNVINPPVILERLQYNMGRPLDGGGTRVMCQDPASKKMFEVIAIPILYPEDEERLAGEINLMLGRYHMHLIKMIDFSIHQIRKFTHTGFVSTDERLALVITDCPVGPLFGDYINLNWSSISNHEFRIFLQQIVNGFMFLHSEGIYHRNVHPGCVVVLMPEKKVEVEDINENEEISPEKKKKLKAFVYDKPICKLGDFWFLHNPRKSGCSYSFGRADWGFAATAAPEVIAGEFITEKSDIWAFGICVYYWATRGLYPNFDTDNLESLRINIPLKWEDWVHSLLRMCLQTNKEYRASADEIFRFLGSVKIKNSN